MPNSTTSPTIRSVSAFAATCRIMARRYSTRRSTSEALVPPKPNEFDSTTSISRSTAFSGARSIGGRDRGVLEVDRRRRDLVADRQRPEDRLDRPGRPEQVPGRGLGRGHRHLPRRVAEQPRHRAELDLVADRRRGAVRVHVVDRVGRELRVLQRRLHRPEAAVAVRRGRGDVVGVARQPVADDLGVDLRAARPRVLELLEHDDAGPLAHHEAVAVLVVGPARPLAARR